MARKLLAALGIDKTIVVDDQAVPGPENMLAAYADTPEKTPLGKDVAWEELDEAAWRQQARTLFEALDNDEKRKVNRRALARLKMTRVGHSDLDLLCQLLGVQQTTLLLPEEWEAKHAELTAVEGAPDSLLVLFDRNLGTGRANAGVTLLATYLTQNEGARAALLTDTIEPDQEISRVDEITRDTPEIRERTLLASKKNLTVTGALEFLNVMRLTANVPTLIEVRDRFLKAMADHHASAEQQFAKLQPRVLEDIVFRSSYTEGAWEFDTLLRLITLFQEQAMREALGAGTGPIPALLAKTRTLIEHGYPDYPPSVAEARRIMATERWIFSAYINPLGLPLANGDVFTVDKKHYILMCQPCDLALRSDGRRKAASTVTLLELKQRETMAPELSNERRYHDLPRGFEHEPQDGYAMIFSPWFDIDVTALDLCTFRADGRASIDLTADEETLPAPLTDGVCARRKRVRELLRDQLALAAACASLDGGQGPRAMSELLRADRAGLLPPVLAQTDANRLTYGARRVGRLAPSFADAALTALASERAREAHEHELDRFGNPPAALSVQSKA